MPLFEAFVRSETPQVRLHRPSHGCVHRVCSDASKECSIKRSTWGGRGTDLCIIRVAPNGVGSVGNGGLPRAVVEVTERSV